MYVLTSWCKWVQYPAPHPSPQPLHRRAICAAKSGNSAPRTKHLENQLDLFLHGQGDCQTTQGFLAHNVLLHHLIIYFSGFVFFLCLEKRDRTEGGEMMQESVWEDVKSNAVNDEYKYCFYEQSDQRTHYLFTCL